MRRIRQKMRTGGLVALASSLLAGVAMLSPTATGSTAATGGEPPQFIVVSFDGGGSIPAWQRWRTLASQVDASMTFFLTGTYLVPEQKAYLYRPPGKRQGASEVGFAAAENVRPRMEQIRAARAEGHEIGTHYNGHFCGSTGVQRWSTADWLSEIRQFNSFLDNWRVNNNATDVRPLGWDSGVIQGGRTPCLEGNRSAMYPAMVANGYRYDTSNSGSLRWPRKMANGMWDIPQQSLRMAGTGTSVLSMDYNFFERQSGAVNGAASRRPAWYSQVLNTYRNAYKAVYNGNRAPLILGAHFNTWNGGIYADALYDFVKETCTKPNTRCVSFVELIDWMESQPASVLAKLQARPTQSMGY
ncbi:hypothetical protein [Sporichthya brevicatena]|uniref:hypothetical protein n=1 Tax=Sporichthya brevicatena TaxID=171442 RepID=UPI0031D856AD